MEQVFDFMRRRVTENTNTGRWGVGVFMDTINEAETKWEADYCKQWNFKENATFMRIHGTSHLVDEAKYFKFCPYCGKPIKISEVE